MTTACAPAPATAVADAWAEMVASLANMVESALTGDGLISDGLSGAETAVGRAGRGAVGADAVEVVAPPALREAVARMVQRAADRYAS